MQKLTYQTTIISAMLLSGYQVSNASENNAKKTNILVFIADDAGMDFGCYGNDKIQTPNIDALAANGLVMENAFLTAPQCSPSRTSMLSGKFAHTIGTEDLHFGIGDTTKLLPSYLSENGYYTGMMLKSHIGEHGEKQFDWYDHGIWPDYYGDGTYDFMENFTTFMDDKKDDSFFLWVAFVDPHRPYTNDTALKNATPAPEIHNPGDVIVPPYLVDGHSTRVDLAHYYDEIHRMDKHIGQMLAELEKRGLRENTLIIFLSDNGMPFPRAKCTVYDAGVQTPLIFAWDGVIKSGTRYSELVSTIDLAPTLMDVAGIETPEDMYGKSIRPVFTDQSVPGREYVFSERNWHGTDAHIRTIRTKKYRFILNSYTHLPNSSSVTIASWRELMRYKEAEKLTPEQSHIFEYPRPQVELYDVENDPYNLINLANNIEYYKDGQELAAQLQKWRKETNDHPNYERRRSDYTDRVTGFPFFSRFERGLPEKINE